MPRGRKSIWRREDDFLRAQSTQQTGRPSCFLRTEQSDTRTESLDLDLIVYNRPDECQQFAINFSKIHETLEKCMLCLAGWFAAWHREGETAPEGKTNTSGSAAPRCICRSRSKRSQMKKKHVRGAREGGNSIGLFW